MFRHLVPCCITFALGFYSCHYEVIDQIKENLKILSENIKGVTEREEPLLYKNGTTRWGTPCLIVRPADHPFNLVKTSEDRQIYDDFTTNQLGMENESSNKFYCFFSVDTEEYKLVSAERTETSALCYQEDYTFEARDCFKYRTSFHNEVQRVCCESEILSGYATCFTKRTTKPTKYFFIELTYISIGIVIFSGISVSTLMIIGCISN